VDRGQIYLREWARALDAPILSVDYGLAPEHPFPVAVCQVW
jgi:acetyl esterase/lipase